MCSKIYSLIFLLGSIQIIFGQPNILICNYGGSYYCNLTVSNSGSEFFIDIGGQHVDGKADSDITEISATALSNSATIPAVICTKFLNTAKITYTSIGLENIDKSAFKGCKVIKQLFLIDNEISSIDELAFSKNIELQKLYLTHNRISTLPNNVFETLVALKQLDISYNHIETLANEWFANLGSLQILNLNNNQITELPSGVFTSLTSLANLNLRSNQLETLNSDSFGNLPSLTLVDVKNNRISAIHEMFIDNTGLTNFIMDGNECANDALIDSSPQKETMKQELATCFENFNNIGKIYLSIFGYAGKLNCL